MNDPLETEPRASGSSRTAASPDRPADEVQTCPRCGKRLIERKCKLLCPDPICGYYLGCSDFY
jgi:hypothetical protein